MNTFNPERYEHVYGIALLDDLHNLFPEILYDTGLFQTSAVVPFVQRRVEYLFGQDYVRNRGHYRIYQQTRRRQESGIRQPLATRAAQLQSQSQSQYRQPRTAPAPPAPLVRTAAAATGTATGTVRETPMVAQRIQIPLTMDSLGSLGLGSLGIGSLGGSLGGSLDTSTSLLLGGLANILLPSLNVSLDELSPVPVVPSREQIAVASILSSVEPARDVLCSICQDHEPPEQASAQWRILRHCNHRFHKHCIDQWFQQNVHCPVCRFDIRDYSAGVSDEDDGSFADDEDDAL